MAQFQFNAAAVQPQQAFEVLPAGDYLAQITESDFKELGSRKGSGLELKFQIIDGQHKGRIVFETLNVVHENAQAQNIAQAQLSAICHNVGVIQMQDTSQLHNRPLVIRLKVEKDESGKYADKNRIRDYLHANTYKGAPTAAGPVGTPAPSFQAAATAMPQQAQPTPAGWGQPQAGQHVAAQPSNPAWGGQATTGQLQFSPAAQTAQQQPQWAAQQPAQQPVAQTQQQPVHVAQNSVQGAPWAAQGAGAAMGGAAVAQPQAPAGAPWAVPGQ